MNLYLNPYPPGTYTVNHAENLEAVMGKVIMGPLLHKDKKLQPKDENAKNRCLDAKQEFWCLTSDFHV